VEAIERLAPRLEATDARAVAIAVASWIVIAVCARVSRLLPGGMIAIGVTTAGVWALGWEQGPGAVAVVGEVPRGLPGVTVPPVSLESVAALLPAIFAIAILGMVEAISIGKAVSARARVKFHANRELLAMGAGNVTGAFFGCMPTSASWT